MKKVTKKKKVKMTKTPKIPVVIGFEEESAKKSGLTKIDDVEYALVKTSAKNKSPVGYEDSFTALDHGRYFIGTHLEFAWLFGENAVTWFKTSPVLSVKKKGKNYLIETENSFYTLKRL